MPGAPTSVSGTAGNAQVSLTWTAPATNGGYAITDYTVQYSSNSGSSWTTFSRAASSATIATVAGLTNGTSYVFRVAAVNSIGTGAYSTASSSVTPLNSSILAFAAAPNADGSVGSGAILYGTSASDWTGSGTAASPYVWRAGQTVSDSAALNALKTTVRFGQGPNAETHLLFKVTAPCYLYIANDLNDDNGNGNCYDTTFMWRKIVIDDNGNTAIGYPGLGATTAQSSRMANVGYPIKVYDASGDYSFTGLLAYQRCLAVDAAHPAYVVFSFVPNPGWCRNLRIWVVPV